MNRVLINGKQADSVDACDRGLQYGDGLFETIAVAGGQPQLWQRHMARLERGCQRLDIPLISGSLLRDEVNSLLSGQDRAVLKIQLTRGCGGRGYSVPAQVTPTRIVSLHPWPDYPEQHANDGIRVHLCRTTLYEDSTLSGIKHLNRLPQVLASREYQQHDCQEGFMFYPDDTLAEGTRSNVFLVAQGELLTPDLAKGGVAGVIRECVLEIANNMGIPVRMQNPGRQQLESMDEIFVCNSLMGIWPVSQVDSRHFAAGPLTRQLQQQLTQYLATEAAA